MNVKNYDDWPIWRLRLAWLWSWISPGNEDWQTIGTVIERKTAFKRCVGRTEK
jgi:hypothetical protein